MLSVMGQPPLRGSALSFIHSVARGHLKEGLITSSQ